MARVSRLLAAILAVLGLAACSRTGAGAAVGMHRDQPPQGGTAVALGDGAYHLEFVRDAGAGRLDAYVLDDEMEEFVRISAPSFDAVATVRGERRPLLFTAVASPATGETVGDTSCFEAQAGWLREDGDFDLVLPRLDLGGSTFTGIAFHFPGDKGPDPGPAAAEAGPLRVVTLSTVLTEIAERVGGNRVKVTGLLRPGVDPHTFEPAPADLRKVVDADLVLASGLGVESYLNGLAANSGTRARIVEAGAALGDVPLFIEEHGRREPDPHWWNSIGATIRVTRLVCSEFSGMRPAGAADFSARADSVVARLAALDAWARAEISVLPPGRRQLVTNHDAFGWFARDYGFTVHPISGLSPEAEPDARDLARLADFVRREGIPALFVESTENTGLAAMLARETGARLGGMLYADGLSPDGDGATYEGMFRHNVRVMVDALSR
jgi:zinc/manganese transport system substrate-binding protein